MIKFKFLRKDDIELPLELCEENLFYDSLDLLILSSE
jgi:hypothetical protein